MPETPSKIRTLRVLSVHNPIAHWQPDSKDSIDHARGIFDSFLKTGRYWASGGENRWLTKFDPEAEEIVLVPKISGGGGPSYETTQRIGGKEEALAGTAQQSMAEFLDLFKADRAKMFELLGPSEDFYTAMASGDRKRMLQAAGPMITEISKGGKAAEENIMATAPRGAGRDVALGLLPMQQAGLTAQAMSQPFLSSFDKLAQLGAGIGSFGLQEAGAGASFGGLAARSLEGAEKASADVMEAQAAKKKATMGFIGDLAGAAIGGPLGAGVFGKIFGGGGGGGFGSTIPADYRS